MKIKFGIIGCGNIGARHAKHINEHKEGILKSVLDINTEKSISIAKKYSCDYFESMDKFLSQDLDIINICTPNGLHSKHAIKCMKAGKHVLVEKPMALKSADCEKMIHTSLNTNKQLFIVKQNRYNPPVVALKEKIRTKKIGNIYSVVVNCFWNRNDNYYKSSDWKGSIQLDGGTLFTQFSHFIDILYYLFGDINNISAWSLRVKVQDIKPIDGADKNIKAPVQTADPMNYGGKTVSLGIGINILLPRGSIGLETYKPISRDLNGPQMGMDWALQAGYQLSF